MKNFNKTKYPLDHEWIDVENGNYHQDVFNKVFNIAYIVCCSKCKLNIIHQEINKNYDDYETIKLCEEDMFYTVMNNEFITSCDVSKIDYENIYSCAEYLIKGLLE